jgi:hypothetical protein
MYVPQELVPAPTTLNCPAWPFENLHNTAGSCVGTFCDVSEALDLSSSSESEAAAGGTSRPTAEPLGISQLRRVRAVADVTATEAPTRGNRPRARRVSCT